MDKNFFKFDIDDEIIKSLEQPEIKNIQKPQNSENIVKNNSKNDNYLYFKGKTSNKNKIIGYEMGVGLANQKAINSNICNVDDYVNFDFRAKQKKDIHSSEISEQISEILSLAEEDKEVKDVVSKAHIGVIFY